MSKFELAPEQRAQIDMVGTELAPFVRGLLNKGHGPEAIAWALLEGGFIAAHAAGCKYDELLPTASVALREAIGVVDTISKSKDLPS